ncbi:SCP-like extracellular [Chlorobaculum parvum NCIB 8327]|uniref:SCP-like extracellular n=1 Tax=Chlorobaculum parvum (strain DSM 263 / NCIMB 8327) TaxID=517417 RepID=B3QPA3_CHLP8|nr:CAP domain-containing protein [Chlorobaculum parvum]ACF11756.1 SCP-like extracellular [Chlorobaculum parvum NCIB 8327]
MPFNRNRIALLVLLLLTLASGQAKGAHVLFKGDSGQFEQGGESASEVAHHFNNEPYLNRTELAIITEINLLRSDPAGYARQYLAPLRKYYNGNLLQLPGKLPIRTREGVDALEECINELENTRPMRPLLPSKGLTLAARDLVQDQGLTRTTGHTGNDGSSMSDRIERYGQWDGCIAENLAYGFDDARQVIVGLLIDDGVLSRGHRKNMLNGTFSYVGVKIGPHRRFNTMCVMEFAAQYSLSEVQPHHYESPHSRLSKNVRSYFEPEHR